MDRDKEDLKATPALAGVASQGQRSDPENFANPDHDDTEPGHVDPHDISTTLMGAQAISAKAAMSSTRMMVNSQLHDRQEAERKAREQEARELASLAIWKIKTVTVGGVQMTNAEAQEARQRFVDNEDSYAERAVRAGYIKAEEKEELKRGMRRKMELEDRTGRGIITEAERKELRDWDRSRVGQAGDKITADFHQKAGVAIDAKMQSEDISSLERSARSTSVARGDEVFQSTQKISPVFSDAVAATAAQVKIPQDAPTPLARKVSTSGLEV